MTEGEMSTEFDVLYQNITSNQAPGLNEYEKSVLLTKAEYALIIDYFNNRTDQVGGGFDGSIKRQYDFSNLLRTKPLILLNKFEELSDVMNKIDKRSIVYAFPNDYFLAVNEILSDTKYQYDVISLAYPEYDRLMLKPYSFPVKKGAWRLISGKLYSYSFSNDVAEIRGLSSLYSGKVNAKDYALRINYDSTWSSVDYVDFPTIADGYLKWKISDNLWGKFIVSETTLANNKKLYTVTCCFKDSVGVDPALTDEQIIKYLKDGCTQLVESAPSEFDNDHELIRLIKFVHGFDDVEFFLKDTTDIQTNALSFNEDDDDNVKDGDVSSVEIIGKFTEVPTYMMRYVKKLKPIILDDLSDYGNNVTIDGYDTPMACELPEETHREIVERAVTLAKITWMGGTTTMAEQQAAQQDQENRRRNR